MSSAENEKMPRLLLTLKEASVTLAISERKMWGMIASGEIPHVRLGRCLRIPADDLQCWVTSQLKGGN